MAGFVGGIAEHVRSGAGPPGCIMVRTMTELGGRPDAPPTAERTCVYRDQVTDALRAALDRAVAAGEIGAGEVDAKASVVLSLYLGALAVAVANPETGAQMLDAGADLVASWA